MVSATPSADLQTPPARESSFLAETFPHFHHLGFQVCGQLLIRLLRSFRFRRRQDGISENHLQRLKSLESSVSRPSLIESFDRYRDDRNLQVNGKDGRALLENLWRSIDGTFALWIQYEREAMSQTECSGAHRGN